MTRDMNVTIIGQVLGTASGWDDVGDQCTYFYDFLASEDNPQFAQFNGGMTFNWKSGEVITYSDDGSKEIAKSDILTLMTMSLTKLQEYIK